MAPRNKIAAPRSSQRAAVLRPNSPSPGLAQETAEGRVERLLPAPPALSCWWMRDVARDRAFMERMR